MTTTQKTGNITFSQEEQEALERLRGQYHPEMRLFTSQELIGLRFLRWRVETGQMKR